MSHLSQWIAKLALLLKELKKDEYESVTANMQSEFGTTKMAKRKAPELSAIEKQLKAARLLKQGVLRRAKHVAAMFACENGKQLQHTLWLGPNIHQVGNPNRRESDGMATCIVAETQNPPS